MLILAIKTPLIPRVTDYEELAKRKEEKGFLAMGDLPCNIPVDLKALRSIVREYKGIYLVYYMDSSAFDDIEFRVPPVARYALVELNRAGIENLLVPPKVFREYWKWPATSRARTNIRSSEFRAQGRLQPFQRLWKMLRAKLEEKT